jgi:hypothetical protein
MAEAETSIRQRLTGFLESAANHQPARAVA